MMTEHNAKCQIFQLFFFFTVTNLLFQILQKSFRLNWQYSQFWTAMMRLYRSAFLSLPPSIPFFFFYKGKKKKILHHKEDAIFHAAVCFVTGASFYIQHCCPSPLLPLLNRPSLHPCWWTRWFLLIYKILIGEILLLQSLQHFHIHSLCSSSFINLLIPPLAPLFRFLLESSTTDLKAKLHHSTRLL